MSEETLFEKCQNGLIFKYQSIHFTTKTEKSYPPKFIKNI